MKEKIQNLEDQEKEQWRDLEGYISSFTALGKTYVRPMYRISSYGRIISDHGQGYKEIEPQVNNYGQKAVMLTGKDVSGKATTEMIALLVARHFVPNPNGYKFIEFKDGNPLNCRADNIEWVKLTNKQKEQYKAAQRKINQYALDGTYLNTYDSILAAVEALKDGNVNSAYNLIGASCRDHKPRLGYQWRYDEDVRRGIGIEKAVVKIITICQLDKKSGEVITKYHDYETIAEKLGKPVKMVRANIINCCCGRRPSAYGYAWSKTEEATTNAVD